MKKLVLPIKDKTILKQVQGSLLSDFRWGMRNYVIFQVGKATLLRVSDVLALKTKSIYNDDGSIKSNAYIKDKKTGKPNILYLNPVKNDLEQYLKWRVENQIKSEWLFPSSTDINDHIKERQYYRIMHKVQTHVGINYLGTHTMRKTGAYMVYEQSGYNIALVMGLLNHSSESMTLRYLGLDQVSRENALDKIDFG